LLDLVRGLLVTLTAQPPFADTFQTVRRIGVRPKIVSYLLSNGDYLLIVVFGHATAMPA
jgi:hypothetical protein